MLVNDDRSVAEVVADGYDAELVSRVAGLVDSAEYKRRQSPLGVRISPRAFGKDRRMPITNRYKDRSTVSEMPTGRTGEPARPGAGHGD